jgi:hypothetical protein
VRRGEQPFKPESDLAHSGNGNSRKASRRQRVAGHLNHRVTFRGRWTCQTKDRLTSSPLTICPSLTTGARKPPLSPPSFVTHAQQLCPAAMPCHISLLNMRKAPDTQRRDSGCVVLHGTGRTYMPEVTVATNRVVGLVSPFSFFVLSVFFNSGVRETGAKDPLVDW